MLDTLTTLFDTVCSVAREISTGEDSKLSHTKIFSSLGYLTGTWIVIHMTLADTLDVDYFIAYLSIVAAHSAVSKYIGSKDQPKDPQ